MASSETGALAARLDAIEAEQQRAGEQIGFMFVLMERIAAALDIPVAEASDPQPDRPGLYAVPDSEARAS